MRQTKREEIAEWMKVNPGKTERDWLLEERCVTERQRSDLRRLLDLCDYLDVSYGFKEIDFMEELNDFCDKNQEDENIKKYKEICLKLIEDEKPVREFDLYFPSKHWVINIGEEHRDVATQMRKNILEDSVIETVGIKPYEDIHDKFIACLNEKYHYPTFDKENDSNKTYLPWCKELEHTNLPYMMGWNIKPDLVSSFYQQLFKEDIEKAREKSIEDFLASNPDLRGLRADRLHDHCKTLLNNNKLELNNVEIQKLLKQVDKELAATYPTFKEAALI